MSLPNDRFPLPGPVTTGDTTAITDTTDTDRVRTFQLSVSVNGTTHDLEVDTRVSLLDLLREHLDLTGTKKGCDHGQCGACTVLLDGRRVNSCLSLAVQADGRDVATVEGLSGGSERPADLHPVQQAFLRHDAFQCGYCTPGQICSAVGMLDEVKNGWPSAVTDDLEAPPILDAHEVQERMAGNLCRCGAYANIVPAVLDASDIAMARGGADR